MIIENTKISFFKIKIKHSYNKMLNSYNKMSNSELLSKDMPDLRQLCKEMGISSKDKDSKLNLVSRIKKHQCKIKTSQCGIDNYTLEQIQKLALECGVFDISGSRREICDKIASHVSGKNSGGYAPKAKTQETNPNDYTKWGQKRLMEELKARGVKAGTGRNNLQKQALLSTLDDHDPPQRCDHPNYECPENYVCDIMASGKENITDPGFCVNNQYSVQFPRDEITFGGKRIIGTQTALTKLRKQLGIPKDASEGPASGPRVPRVPRVPRGPMQMPAPSFGPQVPRGPTPRPDEKPPAPLPSWTPPQQRSVPVPEEPPAPKPKTQWKLPPPPPLSQRMRRADQDPKPKTQWKLPPPPPLSQRRRPLQPRDPISQPVTKSVFFTEPDEQQIEKNRQEEVKKDWRKKLNDIHKLNNEKFVPDTYMGNLTNVMKKEAEEKWDSDTEYADREGTSFENDWKFGDQGEEDWADVEKVKTPPPSFPSVRDSTHITPPVSTQGSDEEYDDAWYQTRWEELNELSIGELKDTLFQYSEEVRGVVPTGDVNKNYLIELICSLQQTGFISCNPPTETCEDGYVCNLGDGEAGNRVSNCVTDRFNKNLKEKEQNSYIQTHIQGKKIIGTKAAIERLRIKLQNTETKMSSVKKPPIFKKDCSCFNVEERNLLKQGIQEAGCGDSPTMDQIIHFVSTTCRWILRGENSITLESIEFSKEDLDKIIDESGNNCTIDFVFFVKWLEYMRQNFQSKENNVMTVKSKPSEPGRFLFSPTEDVDPPPVIESRLDHSSGQDVDDDAEWGEDNIEHILKYLKEGGNTEELTSFLKPPVIAAMSCLGLL
jgi:hypothetical protein